MSFITLIIVISILVFVHEFGHFIVAKKTGVRVDEFSIGFPPRLFSKKYGETLYSINLIPFGGYVKIFGENPNEESLSGPDSKRSFVNKPRHIQATILVAGIAMNILFAWVLVSLSFMLGVSRVPVDASSGSAIFVTEVMKDSPAFTSGIKTGDVIVGIVDVSNKSYDKVSSEFIREIVSNSKGKPVAITYKRDGETFKTSIIPKSGVAKDKLAIGIAMTNIETVKLGFFAAFVEGAKTTWTLSVDTTRGILGFFGSVFSFRADLSQVSGPVGIAGFLNQARQFGASTLFSFVALISINLAVINLMPFPALDGGRLFFVAIESVIRRPINPKISNAINLIGFGILMLLMITITVSDVGKLF